MDDEPDEFDWSDLPETLELLTVAVPEQQRYTFAGKRVILTSIEKWNTRTTLRYVWPVTEFSAPVPPDVSRGFAIGSDGVDYGMSSAGSSGNGLTVDAHFSTASPVPDSVTSLEIFDGMSGRYLRFDLRPVGR